MRIENLKNTNRFYLTDGGLETFMIFEKGFDLPCFSAAALLDTAQGRTELRDYMKRFIGLARQSDRGFVMDVPTWRSGIAWAEPLGLSDADILATNRRAVDFMRNLRDEHETPDLPMVLNGLVGPSGDAYAPDTILTASQARDVHIPQVQTLGDAGVDMITALTLTYSGEAVGIANAAREIDLPVVIGFTLETDGNLPSGQTLADAIAEVDDKTGDAPIYYMINCAHPDHFRDQLDASSRWIERIGSLRANASRMSHAELDACEELDAGNPQELGELNAQLLAILPNIRVIGGCCGTDHRHVGCIAEHERAARPMVKDHCTNGGSENKEYEDEKDPKPATGKGR
ncbi:MAG: homocysteine S-methyltransferase family protein [Pseudomonadota bacterium]